MNRIRHWVFRLGLVALFALWLALMAVSWAEGAHAAETGEDEYSFNWLDPDKKVYVLQNRKYLKGRRILISAMGGIASGSPYRQTLQVDPRLAFYFNETFGLEAFYSFQFNFENSTYGAFKTAAPSASAVVREVRGQAGGLFHYAPWYAKINVFNAILYFDWYFSAGAGMIQTAVDTNTVSAASRNYVSQNLFAGFLGTGHQYHLSDRFLVRLDMTAAIYPAPVVGTSGSTAVFSNYTFGLGLGVKL